MSDQERIDAIKARRDEANHGLDKFNIFAEHARSDIPWLLQKLAEARGAMASQDGRERIAGEACGVPYESHGCDWPDAVAEVVQVLRRRVGQLREENARLREAGAETNHYVCQTLGAALGLPRYCDNPEAWPDTTPEDGVCVGEHTAETLAAEAAQEIERLRGLLAEVPGLVRDAFNLGRNPRGAVLHTDHELVESQLAAFIARVEPRGIAVSREETLSAASATLLLAEQERAEANEEQIDVE